MRQLTTAFKALKPCIHMRRAFRVINADTNTHTDGILRTTAVGSIINEQRFKGLFELIQLNPWRNNQSEESVRDSRRDTGTNLN